MKEGETEPPHEPKEELVDIVAECTFGVDQKAGHEGAPSSPVFLLTGGDPTDGSSPIPPAAPSVYVPNWGITRESLLSQHMVAYDWVCHAFSLRHYQGLGASLERSSF